MDLKEQKLEYVSPAYETVWGLKMKNLTKKPKAWLNVVLKKDLPVMDKLMLEATKKRSSEGEIRLKHSNGKRVWIQMRIWPILNDRGRVVRAAGLAKDITARKEAEQEYRDVVDGSPVGIYVVQDGKIVFANQAAADMFEYSGIDEVRGQPITIVATQKGIEKIMSMGFVDRMSGKNLEPVQYVFEAKKKDGSPFLVEVHSHPTIFQSRHALIGTMMDVTEREEHKQRELELNDLKDKFIRIASHQFRTPLNSIRWNLENLLEEDLGPLNEAQKQFVRLTNEKTTEIIQRIGDLVIALDIKEGQMHLNKERVSLEGLLKSELQRHQKLCTVKNLTCVLRPPKSPVDRISGDSEKLRIVIDHLLQNAIEYSHSGGKVSATITAKPEAIRLSIRDQGIGIPKAEQKFIFQEFFRASNASLALTDASGLGLFISQNIIKAHNGKMGFTSQEGKGSTFWFELPK